MDIFDKNEFLQFLKKNQSGVYCFDFPVDKTNGFVSNLLVKGQGPVTEIKERGGSIKFSCLGHCFVIGVGSLLKFTRGGVLVHDSFNFFDTWISIFFPKNRENEIPILLKEIGLYDKLKKAMGEN